MVHISAVAIAVIALVHDDRGAWTEIGFHERSGLVEISDFGAGENETEGIPKSVHRQMNLGRHAGARAAHRLGELATGRVRPMGMHAHRGAVDHQIFIVPQT